MSCCIGGQLQKNVALTSDSLRSFSSFCLCTLAFLSSASLSFFASISALRLSAIVKVVAVVVESTVPVAKRTSLIGNSRSTSSFYHLTRCSQLSPAGHKLTAVCSPLLQRLVYPKYDLGRAY